MILYNIAKANIKQGIDCRISNRCKAIEGREDLTLSLIFDYTSDGWSIYDSLII